MMIYDFNDFVLHIWCILKCKTLLGVPYLNVLIILDKCFWLQLRKFINLCGTSRRVLSSSMHAHCTVWNIIAKITELFMHVLCFDEVMVYCHTCSQGGYRGSVPPSTRPKINQNPARKFQKSYWIFKGGSGVQKINWIF